jgi:hypothetical protein
MLLVLPQNIFSFGPAGGFPLARILPMRLKAKLPPGPFEVKPEEEYGGTKKENATKDQRVGRPNPGVGRTGKFF